MNATGLRYLSALRRFWWLLVLLVLGTGVASYVVAQRLPRVYEAQTTLLVNFTSPGTGQTYNDALLSQQLVKTYTQMAAQPVVLERVAADLQLNGSVPALESRVSAQPVRDTQLFVISARDSDPARARDIANDVATVFLDQQRQRLEQNQAANAISVAQPALLPVQAVEPRPTIYAIGSGLGALIIGLAIVYVLTTLDDTIETAAEAEHASELVSLGTIPKLSGRSRELSVEAFRMLRTSLSFAITTEPRQTMLVTSAGPGEGKTTIAVNLAMAIAQTGAHVILIDADLRKPSVHSHFAFDNSHGLADLLKGLIEDKQSVRDCLQPTPLPSLRVLTSGQPVASGTELIEAEFMAVLQLLKGQDADLIVVDGPPVLAVADALLLARSVDAAVLVVEARLTKSRALREASSALRQSGVQLAGVVVNKSTGGWESYARAYAEPPILSPRTPDSPATSG